MRGSTISTPWRKRSFWTSRGCEYCTLISAGRPGSQGGTAERFESACFAPSWISSRATTGGRLRALKRPRPRLTATVVSPVAEQVGRFVADGLVAGDEQHGAAEVTAERGVDPGLADERRR